MVNNSKEKLSGGEVVERVGKDVVVKVRRLILLTDLLVNSIILDDYSPTEELSNAIVLSELGNRATRKISLEASNLGPQSGRPRSRSAAGSGQARRYTREARLMCLLELGNGEPLIDVEAIDIDKLAKAISDEVKAKRIVHPNIYGPALYERADDLFVDLTPELDYAQTMELLDGQPQGVYQMGEWLSGPMGVTSVSNPRFVPPITRIPLQHCHDVTCQVVHSVRLRTSRVAPINSQREAMHSFRKSEGLDAHWDWTEAFAAIFDDADSEYYSHDSFAGLLPVVGDCFDVGELRLILEELAMEDQSAFRQRMPGRIRKLKDYVENLDHATALQAIFQFSDREIANAIDGLIVDRPPRLEIPSGEVRRPVLSRPRGHGFFSTRVEVSEHGVRIAARRQLAVLRFENLLGKLYPGGQEAEELDWKIRKFAGPDRRSKVDSAIRDGGLLGLIESLILDSKLHGVKAAEELRIRTDLSTTPNLREVVAWKLGFDSATYSDVFESFAEESTRFRAAVTAETGEFMLPSEGAVGPMRQGLDPTHRRVREASASYFIELERILHAVVGFSAWALLAEHHKDGRPFSYDPVKAFAFAASTLNGALPENHSLDNSGQGSAIGAEVEAIGALAGELKRRMKDTASIAFPEGSIPEVVGHSSLVSFPFASSTIFDSLPNLAQERIVGALEVAHRKLASSEVAKIRNRNLHYRANTRQVDDLASVIDAVLSVMQALDRGGFVPAVYSLVEKRSGRWGKESYLLSARERRVFEVLAPRREMMSPMPTPSSDQIIFPMAEFEPGGAVASFHPGADSNFTKRWAAVPARRRKKAATLDGSSGMGIGEGARGLD